jgi:hypothetical protein
MKNNKSPKRGQEAQSVPLLILPSKKKKNVGDGREGINIQAAVS